MRKEIWYIVNSAKYIANSILDIVNTFLIGCSRVKEKYDEETKEPEHPERIYIISNGELGEDKYRVGQGLPSDKIFDNYNMPNRRRK